MEREEKEILNHVALLVLRVNLLKGKSGLESKIKQTDFRGLVHIGFIDIGLLQLKEKGLQEKQKRKEEGKYGRKRKKKECTREKRKKSKRTTEKEEEGKHEREREREIEPFMSSWSAITSLGKLLAATS